MTGVGDATSRDELRSRLVDELAVLESCERPRLLAGLGVTEGKDVADQADRHVGELELAQVNHRIHRLRNRLAALDEVPAPSSGACALGTVVVIDLGDGPETFVLAEFPYGGFPAITPDSPLGRALTDARPGATVRFRAPRGESTVTVLAVGDDRPAAA